MDSVKVNRTKLLEIVYANKEKHIKEYSEAVKDFKLAVLKICNENMELAEAGKLDLKAMPPKPTSYENNYAKAIRMLELSVDDVIELNEYDFTKLVQDEWEWKQVFSTMNSTYKTMNGSF
jgi:hypothetical protein